MYGLGQTLQIIVWRNSLFDGDAIKAADMEGNFCYLVIRKEAVVKWMIGTWTFSFLGGIIRLPIASLTLLKAVVTLLASSRDRDLDGFKKQN